MVNDARTRLPSLANFLIGEGRGWWDRVNLLLKENFLILIIMYMLNSAFLCVSSPRLTKFRLFCNLCY